MKISVIITNWNGLKIIRRSLPEILQNTPQADEFIVVDDASTDKSVNFIRSLQPQYPKLKLIVQKSNKGFANTSNLGVSQSCGDLIVLLNNDIFPTPHYLKAAIQHFQNPTVFGVGFSEIDNENWAKLFWKHGYLQYSRGSATTNPHISAWVSGGSSIVRRQYFIKLGGFDEIYAPFYSEDLDLGYRAWKSGYKLLWEPKSQVYHRHGTTNSQFPRHYLDYVQERNRLLTVWRNITDPKLIHANRLAMLGRVLGGPNYVKIIKAAAQQSRRFPPPIVYPVVTDQQILDLFQKP